ncbi:MAG: 16S rRNA (cytosine(1402)-N(4))-methyltransferase RsmH [Bacteroidota bacterium]
MCKYPVHQPVLLAESLASLAIRPAGTYVDVTFGQGGHARAILQQLQGGRLLAFDQDQDAAVAAHQIQQAPFTFIRANAKFMQPFLAFHGVDAVDGIFADVGISSHQLDTADRGFATRLDARLDMRMDQENTCTAQHVVNTYAVEQLVQLLQNYGEIRPAYPVARAIDKARRQQAIRTTGELKGVVMPFAPRHKCAQYLARVFQAFRIEVNDELGALRDILRQSAQLLKPGGRLVVIAYHSLEDRLVKRFMRTGNFTGEPQQDVYGHLIRPLQAVGRKPIRPSEQEVQANPRARSAKLRVAERL